MLTPLCSIEPEHVYTRRSPAALSVLHRFRYLLVLSNAQDPIFSKSSLPNVRGVFSLSPPRHQPAVLHPSTRPSANMFTNSRLKRASSMGIGVHSILRILGSLIKDRVNLFIHRLRRYEFVVRVSWNVFNHVYAILKYPEFGACWIHQRHVLRHAILWRRISLHGSLCPRLIVRLRASRNNIWIWGSIGMFAVCTTVFSSL